MYIYINVSYSLTKNTEKVCSKDLVHEKNLSVIELCTRTVKTSFPGLVYVCQYLKKYLALYISIKQWSYSFLL